MLSSGNWSGKKKKTRRKKRYCVDVFTPFGKMKTSYESRKAATEAAKEFRRGFKSLGKAGKGTSVSVYPEK